MPEGDTVWLAAKRMNTALAGATLRRGELRVPQLAAVDLAGATVREVVPRGKHMLIRLADDPMAPKWNETKETAGYRRAP